jgi:hypothetical protein
MMRAAALLLLLLPVACAETQSGRAFIPRQAAQVEIPAVTPNKSAERGRELADALEASLKAQEAIDEALPTTSAPEVRRADSTQPVAPAEATELAPATTAHADHSDKADRTPVAAFR